MAQKLVTVKVAQGVLRGMKGPCRGGGLFYSFKGVPYAKPPLGPLRFKDPQPADPWSGARDALKEGDKCTQWDSSAPGGLVGNEDCLYLNVFAPEVAAIGGVGGAKLPVMVYFHGGGFVRGSAEPASQGGDYFMTEDVLVVTVAYRLGPFGFLFLGHEAAPGNYGLKDQVAALRWVKDNIAAFGGDPDNVTIFGTSAGGVSVHYHMMSPLSQGLFHRAIAQSGTALCPWSCQYEPVQTAKRLAKALGCGDDEPTKMVAFLRGVDHFDLCSAATFKAALPRERMRLLAFTFVPSPEVPAPDAEMFLPAPPLQLVLEGRRHPVPFMTGFNTLEALVLLMGTDLSKEATAKKVDAAWEETVLPETRLAESSPTSSDAARELRRFFLGGRPLSKDTLVPFLQMLSDLMFAECAHCTVKHMVQNDKAPVYLYHFTFEGELNHIKRRLTSDIAGSTHSDEKGYMLRIEKNDPDLPEDHPAAVTRRRVLRLWANFARSGNPTPKEDPLLGAQWDPYTAQKRSYLDIGDELRQRSDLLKERFDFWDNFYATFGQ